MIVDVTLYVREADSNELLSEMVVHQFEMERHPTLPDTAVLKVREPVAVPITKASGLAEFVRVCMDNVQVTELGPVIEGCVLTVEPGA